MKLKDKVVVITGSTRGIGRAIARSCAQQGAKADIVAQEPGKDTGKTYSLSVARNKINERDWINDLVSNNREIKITIKTNTE